MSGNDSTSRADSRSDEGWLKIIEDYEVGYLALDPEADDGLVRLVQSRPEWRVDFEDQEFVLFVRTDFVQAGSGLVRPLGGALATA